MGYKKIDFDLNKGSGGDYVFLYIKPYYDDEEIIAP